MSSNNTMSGLATLRASAVDYFRAERKSGKAQAKLAELFVGGGGNIQWLFAPAKDDKSADEAVIFDGERTTHREVHAMFKDAQESALTAAERKLIAAPVKSLSEGQKDQRNEINREINRNMGNLRGAIERRLKASDENDDKESKGGNAKRRTRTLRVRVLEECQEFVKKIQDDDKPDYDSTALVKALNAAIAVAKVQKKS